MIQHIAFGLATALLSLALTLRLAGPDLPAFHRYTNRAYEASPEAFCGLGRLAYLKEGQIHLLDGATDTIQVVENSEGAGEMAWSQDGKWLAFVRNGELMIAAAAELDVHLVDLPGTVNRFAWSPAGNVLAVSLNPGEPAQFGSPSDQATPITDFPLPASGPAQPQARDVLEANRGPSEPAQSGGAIWLVTDPAEPKARPLLTLDRPVGAVAWSPDGDSLAYVSTLPGDAVELRSDALEVVPASGGEPTQWYVADQAAIELAGWWPDGQGILFWAVPLHSPSIAADGLPLQSLAVGSSEPIALPTMLLNASWISWDPSGKTLAVIAGGGRMAWDQKNLAFCDAAAGECRFLPQPKEQVTLDAAWSPGGEQIAMIRADRQPGMRRSRYREDLEAWAKSRTLWLTDPDGTSLREIVSVGRGVHSPAWSKDGHHLLYVKDDALWVLDLKTNRTNRVISLQAENTQSEVHGAVNWWNGMTWHQR